jgi:glutamate-1-semialdehyde 2,1-aminomutase
VSFSALTRESTDRESLLATLDRVVPGGALVSQLSYDKDKRFLAAYGSGSGLYDTDGRRFIDYLMGSGPLILGHCHPAVVEAVTEQVKRGSAFYAPVDSMIELADELVRTIPCCEQVRFVTTGTEATYYALRLARAYTRRERILKFAGGYHGTHDYSMVGWHPPSSYNPSSAPTDSAGIPAGVAETVLVAEFNDLDSVKDLLERHENEVAAIIVEPILGVIPPEDGFLQGLRKLADEHQALLIFDEIITGFRIAYGGAQERFGVIPDLACFGKIIGGGFPIGALCGRSDLIERTGPAYEGTPDHVFFSGTFYVNPVAAVAGLATLEVLQQPGSYDQLEQTADALRVGIRSIAASSSIPVEVVGIGPVFNVFFSEHPVVDFRGVRTSDAARASQLVQSLATHQVLVAHTKGWVSLAHDEDDVAQTLDAYSKAFAELQI